MAGAWAGQPHWRILDTAFAGGAHFLRTWRAWQDDPQRPGFLHFVAIAATAPSAGEIARAAAADPALTQLATELASQAWGLTPGFHRLVFAEGRVLLTLCVGELQGMLREQAFVPDAIVLDDLEVASLKGVARLCRRGTLLWARGATPADRPALHQCGFEAELAEQGLHGRFEPAWAPKGLPAPRTTTPGQAVVIGAGLAGAAVAASLARRGWRVQVLDAAAGPAAGASGLPAGLLAPSQSPDDNPLSRLSRAGVRMTLQQAAALLPEEAWRLTGVLEHRLDDQREPPEGAAMRPWTRTAETAQKAGAGLPPDTRAWWHEKAAWIRPAALVRAWLEHPAIERRGHARVHALARGGAQWELLGAQRELLARGDLVVVAAALDSASLLPQPLKLNPVRGQVSWSPDGPLPLPFPVNGHGHFLPDVMLDGGRGWLSGSTYGRGDTMRDERPQDHQANLARLRELLPAAAEALAPRFASGTVQAWTGVRCTSADRRPLVGEVAPGLCISAAHGSRGLTFTALCAELLVARLHGEPLPVEKKLADALDVRRQLTPGH